MHPRLKSVSLLTTILLLSLTPTLILPASAQTPTTQNLQSDVDKLFQEGVQQFRRGDYPKAVQTYQRVLELRRQQNDKAGIAQTLNNMGEVYSWLRQPDKALEVLQQALSIRRELKNRVGEGETLDNLGFAYYLKQQEDKALETFQEALAIRQEVGDKAGEGQTLSNIGLVYAVGLQQYPKGLETLQQALAIHEQLGDKFQAGITLRRIGRFIARRKTIPALWSGLRNH
jgi:tetratricopeptide (TPR) repeat protein